MGRDSVVRIATRYGLDGPGIEILWKWDFRAVHTGPEAYPASCNMRFGTLPRGQSGWCVAFTNLTSSAEVKEMVNLQINPSVLHGMLQEEPRLLQIAKFAKCWR